MIIFDLDGTLADCEHRRHFVDRDPEYRQNDSIHWKPDWDAFNEACDNDKPIDSVIHVLDGIYFNSSDTQYFLKNVQVWSGRSESVRKKTIDWLDKHTLFDGLAHGITVKMRPIGDYTPDDILKERWLDEAIAEGKKIDFVFDDRPKVIKMWRRRGIFVFNCCQHDEEF